MTMGLPSETLESKLKQNLDATYMKVEDMSDGCGAKFNVLIVSPKFEGVTPTIKRHSFSASDLYLLVHAIIAEEMKVIHAIQLKTLTPEEWEKQCQS